MNRVIGLISVLLTLTTASAVSPVSINPETFVKTPPCIRFKCRALGQSGGVYRFSIPDEYVQQSTLITITKVGKVGHLQIYGGKGSLKFSPTFSSMAFLQAAAQYYAGAKLRLWEDIAGGNSMVETQVVDFFDLTTGKLGGVPVTVYEKSLPDPSGDLAKGQLVYGIIETKLYPPR